MPLAAKEQIHTPLPPEIGELHDVQEQSMARRLRTVGRNTLAIAGMSLAFLAAEGPPASADQPVAHAIGTVVAPAPLTPVTPTDKAYAGSFEVGVSTYSWLGDDPGNLFSDMHALGMTGVRLNLVRESYQHDLSVLRPEIANAATNDVDVSVLLEQTPYTSLAGFAQWTSQMAAQLPRVHRFVIDNEVNSPYFWPCVKGTPKQQCMQEYVDTLYKTNEAIHAVRPDALVSGFGLASGYGPMAYMEQASQYATLKYGGLQNTEDDFSTHFYRDPVANMQLLKQEELIVPGVFHVDEGGQIVENSGQSVARPYYVSPNEQALNEMWFITQLQQDPRVENFFNNRWGDSPDPTDNYKTGLITAGGKKRPLDSMLGSYLNHGDY